MQNDGNLIIHKLNIVRQTSYNMCIDFYSYKYEIENRGAWYKCSQS